MINQGKEWHWMDSIQCQNVKHKTISKMKPKVQNWITQLQNGVIKTKTTRILKTIHSHTNKKGFTTIHELREELNFPHQTLTAILSMVQDEGMIDMFGEYKIGDTIFQKIRYARPSERQHLIYLREKDKFIQWCKRGLNDFNRFLPDEIEQDLKEWIEENK